MAWNPDTYLTFAAAREAPFDDLLALIDKRPNMRVVDLGCGTGKITKQLAAALPDSDVTGIDSSPDMLEQALPLAGPRITFKKAAIDDFEEPADLIFSHAALHWVPDHPKLLTRLFDDLRPGGQLAVQVPSNHHHVSHRSVVEVARLPRFRELLDYVHRSPVLPIDQYAALLHSFGATDVNVFEKVYPVLLEGVDGLMTWLSGSTLVPYLSRLPESEHGSFRAELRRRYTKAGLDQPRLFYPFRRTLFACRKPADA